LLAAGRIGNGGAAGVGGGGIIHLTDK